MFPTRCFSREHQLKPSEQGCPRHLPVSFHRQGLADTGLRCPCAEARLLPTAPCPSPAPRVLAPSPAEGGMANGTGSCWAFGDSVLSLELPFTLSPDSDPCGTSKHPMVFGLRAVVTSAVCHWLHVPVLAILSYQTRRRKLMLLQAVSLPAQGSLPAPPSRSSARMAELALPSTSDCDLISCFHLVSIKARGRAALTLHLAKLPQGIFLTCSITKIKTRGSVSPHSSSDSDRPTPHGHSSSEQPEEELELHKHQVKFKN